MVALDGADYALTRRWMDEGRLPNLARLAETGSFHPLRPTAPLTSPSAWASLTTGTTPEKHGIWDAPVQHARLPYAPAPSPVGACSARLRSSGTSCRATARSSSVYDRRLPSGIWQPASAFPPPSSGCRALIRFPARPSAHSGCPEAPDALVAGPFTYPTTAEGETVAATDFFSGPVVRLTREGIWITGTVPGPISPTVRQRMAGSTDN
ncbi:alkaline phosphatase family protein [bacterium]|nr:alkaline phosphatase family protein [bacterium]